MLGTSEEWRAHAQEGSGAQAERPGAVNPKCSSSSFVNRQTQVRTALRGISCHLQLGRLLELARVGENSVPPLLLAGLAAGAMRCEDPALCGHTACARQV